MEQNEDVENKPKRYAGILLHPTSFPNHYGIGDLGQSAYDFVDFLAKSGMTAWQVLPLGHTGFGDSPYQPFSSFAGQPLIISVDHLKELGLLIDSDFSNMPQWNPESISYGDIIKFKTDLLHTAYERFSDGTFKDYFSADKKLIEDFSTFKKESSWLNDYALFMAGKDFHEGAPWYLWEDSLKNPSASQRKKWEEDLSHEMGYYQFIQFLFYNEWTSLKKYANEKGISIIGDIPIFVAWDSVDVWMHKNLFMLDEKGYPTDVAGVPPDYFSATGQLWGNPLYNWPEHTKTGYEWWFERIRHQLELTDFLRIDHFRGFDKFWAIPFGDTTAENGRWITAPGDSFFTMMEATFGYHMPIIAEDLGEIDRSVVELRDKFGFPGMKVMQFAFENPEENNFLPHNHVRNCVCYTGTHDNDTTLGWYKNCYEASRDKLRRYYSTDGNDICWVMIRTSFGSVANMAIVPMQDILELDSWARMNKPGTGEGNWTWRYKAEVLTDQLAARLFETAKMYGR